MRVNMTKKLFPLTFLMVSLLSSLSIVLLITFTMSVGADSAIIKVPADYPTIQTAVDVANSGDIILVTSGTYYEHVNINKSLTLIGEDTATTIIDGNRTEIVGIAGIVSITADSVVIDGFTIRNSGVLDHGVYLSQSNNSTISGNVITSNNRYGISLNHSNNNVVTGNAILSNGDGYSDLPWGGNIELLYSNSNLIDSNTIANSVTSGLDLEYSNNNFITGNTIANNQFGSLVDKSRNNTIYHNNLIDEGITLLASYNILWDNGTEGNYWSDYTGLDDGSGGRIAGDGIGDTDLPHQEVDYYPLIIPWGPIPVVWGNSTYPVKLLSNSTVSTFQFLQPNKKIGFDVTGPPGIVGYCNVTIPKTLLRDNPWKVLLNTTDITTQTTITENETHTSLHFTYTHGTYKVQIIGTWVVPEFPATTILPLFMILTLCVVALTKKRKS